MKNNLFLLFLFFLATVLIISCSKENDVLRYDKPVQTSISKKWVCSKNLRIAINQVNNPTEYLTSGYDDYKPVWSSFGNQITFFRIVKYGNDFKDWRTKLCVINADGNNFKELTSGLYPDFNPTWTRDGSNKIIFNRYSTSGGWDNKIYLISPDDSIQSEVLISQPSKNNYEWAMSCLKDGRIFIDRTSEISVKSFLLTPNPGSVGVYEEIKRPTEKLWHKLSVSPDETKVTYMLDMDNYIPTYEDVLICYADFDIENLEVKNQIIITENNPDAVHEYPRWSEDEKYIIYDSNKSGKYKMYAYCIEPDTTYIISSKDNSNYQFGNFINLPK